MTAQRPPRRPYNFSPLTPEQKAFIVTHYEEKGQTWCAEQLGVPRGKVRNAATYLGLRTVVSVVAESWSYEEDAILIRFYRYGWRRVAMYVNRSQSGIEARAAQLGDQVRRSAYGNVPEVFLPKEPVWPSITHCTRILNP